MPSDDGFEITMRANGQQEVFVTEKLINAAGMMSDDIARMIQPDWLLQPPVMRTGGKA